MNDKFLDAYRNLENELRYESRTVLDYENALQDEDIKDKLKLCRITRNYLAHHDTKFVTATLDMCKFLDQLSIKVRQSSGIVRDEMKKTKAVIEGEALKNILPLVAKGVVPIINKQNQCVFILDSDYYVNLMAKKATKLELPKKLPKYNYVKKEDRLDGLYGFYIVTEDGTSKGKYLGTLNIEN